MPRTFTLEKTVADVISKINWYPSGDKSGTNRGHSETERIIRCLHQRNHSSGIRGMVARSVQLDAKTVICMLSMK